MTEQIAPTSGDAHVLARDAAGRPVVAGDPAVCPA